MAGLLIRKKNLIITSLICISLLIPSVIHPNWEALWVNPWGIFLLSIGIYLIAKIPISTIYKLCIGYIYAQAITKSFLFIPKEYTQDISSLRAEMLEYCLLLVCFIGFIHHRINLRLSLKVASFIGLLGIIFSKHPLYQVIFLDNPSLAATFVVLASGLNPLSIIAIVMTRSWTAAIAFLVGFIYKIEDVAIKRMIILCSMIFFFIYIGLHGIPDNGRFDIAKDILQFYHSKSVALQMTGLGIGTSSIYLPILGLSHQYSQVAIFVHNDWIQLFVETGFIGSSLIILSLLKMYKDSDRHTRAMILAYGSSMCSHYPTHMAVTALVAWDILGRSIKYGELG